MRPRYASAALLLFSWLIAAPAAADGVETLFNGRNLDGWVAEGVSEIRDGSGTRPVWSARDGMIACEGSGFGFLRYAGREFGDFVLHVEYRMEPGGNTGVGIRTRPFDPSQSRATRPSFYSYEIQLVDDAGKPPSPHSTGSLYRYVAPKTNPVEPAGAWNALEIECRGPRIQIRLNDELILDVDQSTIESLKEKPLSGYVCLQNHGRRAEFRNVRIRDLSTDPDPDVER